MAYNFNLVVPLIFRGTTIDGSEKYIKKATENLIESGANLASIIVTELDMDRLNKLLSMNKEEFNGVMETMAIPQLRDAFPDNYKIGDSLYHISYTDDELLKSLDTDNYKGGVKKAITKLFSMRKEIGKNHTLGFIIIDVKVKDQRKQNYLKIMVRPIIEEMLGCFRRR